jgi:hypothetical protein
MSGLGRDAMDFLAEARDGDDPSPEDRARVRRRLVQLGVGTAVATAASGTAAASGGAGAGLAGSATAKGALAGGVAAGGGAIASVGAASSSTLLVLKLAVAVVLGGSVGAVGVKGVEAVRAHHAPAVDARATEPEPARPGVGVPVAPASPLSNTSPTSPPAAEDPATGDGTPAVTVSAGARPRSQAPSRADTVDVETRLLRMAEASRQDGDAARALQLLDQHASQFPRGALAEERAAERIFALCDLGRVAEATAEAQRFLTEHPRSPQGAHVRASCARASGR